MSLSVEVADLDPHEKKVLSDEIGCGISFLICSRILATSVYLDLCDAIRSSATGNSSKSQPR